MKVLAFHLALLCPLGVSVLAADSPVKPNIVIILADDLGYGDAQCYNPQRGKIPTPSIDRLAAQGMRFTDGHSSSAVCSPSRYTLLTGRYHWRTRLQSGIVPAFGAPLITPERLTIASLLKRNGYRTAAIGKWHLGWDWPIPPAKAAVFRAKPLGGSVTPPDDQRAVWKEVFSQPIAGGPTTCGFDAYFGTDLPNFPPFCFIENDHTVGVPSEFLPAELLKKQANLADLPGPALPGWKLERILPTIGDRACAFVAESAKKLEPFFLYLPLTAPHTPLAVNAEWRGRSGLNTYADFVMETDAVVGRVLAALEKSGIVGRTLVVFTSDNGCAPYIGTDELQRKGHFPSGPLRGWKTDIWEGGHRVPFIVRWPGVVRAGTRCDQLVQQADLLATCADILGVKLRADAGEDSVSLLPLLRGSNAPVRTIAVNQSLSGLLAIRKGEWKLIFGSGPGGYDSPRDAHPAQIFNLVADLGETTNLRAEKPDVVAELTALMEKLVNDGRSTPGAPQTNDVRVNWRRFLSAGDGVQKAGRDDAKTGAAP